MEPKFIFVLEPYHAKGMFRDSNEVSNGGNRGNNLGDCLVLFLFVLLYFLVIWGLNYSQMAN